MNFVSNASCEYANNGFFVVNNPSNSSQNPENLISYVRYNLHNTLIIVIKFIGLSKYGEQMYSFLTLDGDKFALINSTKV